MHQHLSVLIALAALCAAAPSILSKRAHCIGENQVAMCGAKNRQKQSRIYTLQDALTARSIAQEIVEEEKNTIIKGVTHPTPHNGNYPGYEPPFTKFPISRGEGTVHHTHRKEPFCDYIVLDKNDEIVAILDGLAKERCPIVNQN